MPTRLARRILAFAGALATVGGAAVATPGTADAAATFTRSSGVVVGDLTGDHVADRAFLGYIGDQSALRCAVQLSVGLGQGRFATPVVVGLPARGVVTACPDLGVVVPGPTAAQNRLATAFFEFSPSSPDLEVQLFGYTGSSFARRGSFAGMPQPSGIATQNFDGDGWGDIWEQTDQGSGFQAFVNHGGAQWRELYGTPATSAAFPQFVDFNHAGGTDILVSWTEFGQGAGVAVIDGKTGAAQTLGSSTPDDPTTFTANPADLDHNGFLDVQIRVEPTDEPAHYLDFVNRSQGGRWFFRQLPPST